MEGEGAAESTSRAPDGLPDDPPDGEQIHQPERDRMGREVDLQGQTDEGKRQPDPDDGDEDGDEQSDGLVACQLWPSGNHDLQLIPDLQVGISRSRPGVFAKDVFTRLFRQRISVLCGTVQVGV